MAIALGMCFIGGSARAGADNAITTATYTSDPAHPVPYTEDVHLDRTKEYMSDDQRFAARFLGHMKIQV